MLCAIMGFPVKHSLSPEIYKAFALHTGVSLHCERIEVTPGAAECSLRNFIARGGVGTGVTVPLKEEAYRLMAHASEEAHQAGAVSMIHCKDGVMHGYNFDGIGLMNDLKRMGTSIAGRHVLLLGAGGAAKGVLPMLLSQGPSELVIANRTLEKASALAARYPGVIASTYEALKRPFDIIINATSASLEGMTLPLSPNCVGQESLCYDMMYAKTPTTFLAWAMACGATRVGNGLGMLVAHCASVFPVWTGRIVDERVIAAVREGVGSSYRAGIA